MDKTKKSLLALTAVALGTLAYNALKPVVSRVDVVEPFDIKKYLGKWYEIARLPVKFEKRLIKVTAEYRPNPDGSIAVHNQGYSLKTKQWRQAVGKAKFVDGPRKGALKVSFFGPFYSGYNVVRIDSEYQYALVFGENLDYLWILSRTKEIPAAIRQEFLEYARASGYEVSNLIWTEH